MQDKNYICMNVDAAKGVPHYRNGLLCRMYSMLSLKWLNLK